MVGGEVMKVVLRRDVPTLGKAGEVKDVADGYGRNFLIPRGLAAPASRTAMENVDAHKAAEARRRERLDEEAQALAKRIEETPIIIHARTGEGGRLYGSVTSLDIAEALSTEVGAMIDKRNVDLGEPIRHVGTHTARIHIAPRVTVPLSVQVEPE
jgi:large subunit ribosomal protein L9